MLYQELGKINDDYSVLTSKLFLYQFKGEDDGHDEKDNLNQTTKLASFFVTPDTDNDSMVLEYTGERELLYSDPKVLAVIAAPPAFEDLAEMDGGDDYFGNSITVFGEISGYSSTSSMNGLFSVGGYFNINIGWDVAKHFDIEFEYTHDMTFVSENTVTNEQTIEYETAMQDTVILYSMPIEVYKYKVIAPSVSLDGTINDEPMESELTITVPYDPVMQAFLLEDYDAIAQQYPDLLVKIGGNILTHTVGRMNLLNFL